MKLIRITEGDQAVIGILHDAGRIERITHMDAASCGHIATRIVAAMNACDGISDKTLEILGGGSSSGTIAERVTAWSLFAAHSRPTAERIMGEARRALAKQGGEL